MRDRSQARCVLVQPQVATVLVIVADVSSHEPDEMTCAENHDVLKELATAAADPPLRSSVLPWAVLPPSSVATPCLNASVSWPACVGVHTKVSLNVRHRVVSPARIVERTASLEIGPPNSSTRAGYAAATNT